MSGYTPLFKSLINSTVWQESQSTKVVWITILALKNRKGIIESSIPGLARASGTTIQECEESLKVLMSPDLYSRTKDFDGRRIEEVDGGWIVLNHEKYCQKARSRADYYREYRARNIEKPAQPVAQQVETHCNRLRNIGAIPICIDVDVDIAKDKVKDKDKEEKKLFLDFVYLKDSEYDSLVKEFGEEVVIEKIRELNAGIGSKGYKYKSHYHTILSWHNKNTKKDKEKTSGRIGKTVENVGNYVSVGGEES
jgi:hypothetical protein